MKQIKLLTINGLILKRLSPIPVPVCTIQALPRSNEVIRACTTSAVEIEVVWSTIFHPGLIPGAQRLEVSVGCVCVCVCLAMSRAHSITSNIIDCIVCCVTIS